jgi:hypothetical protein
MLEPYVQAILVRLTTEQTDKDSITDHLVWTLCRLQRTQSQTGQRLTTPYRFYERKQAMKTMCCDVARQG